MNADSRPRAQTANRERKGVRIGATKLRLLLGALMLAVASACQSAMWNETVGMLKRRMKAAESTCWPECCCM